MTQRGRAAPGLGLVLVIVASALFALNGSVSKMALDAGLESTELVQIRLVGACLCFIALTAWQGRRDGTAPRRVGRRELAGLAVIGLIGVGGVQWLYLVAIERMPAGIALLLEFLAPVFVVLWVKFVRGEPVANRMWIALACCLAGLALVAQIGSGADGLDGVGVLAAVGAALALAAYFLTSERGLARRDPVSFAAWTFAAAAAFWSVLRPPWTFPWSSLAEGTELPDPLGVTVPLGALVTWIVVLGTVAPYVLVLHGLRHLGSARTGLVGMCEPVLTAAAAWYLLGQSLTARQVVGGLVVLVGIGLAETARRSTPAKDGPVIGPGAADRHPRQPDVGVVP